MFVEKTTKSKRTRAQKIVKADRQMCIEVNSSDFGYMIGLILKKKYPSDQILFFFEVCNVLLDINDEIWIIEIIDVSSIVWFRKEFRSSTMRKHRG